MGREAKTRGMADQGTRRIGDLRDEGIEGMKGLKG